MNEKQFKEFCKKEFEARGLKKQKNVFYMVGCDLLCEIELSKSNYNNEYYVDFCYFIGNHRGHNKLPNYYDSDIEDRILVMSKKKKVNGKCFLTAMIEYEEYTEEDLRIYFDKEFKERILPPILQGKKYILDNLGEIYFLTVNKDEVRKKLNS